MSEPPDLMAALEESLADIPHLEPTLPSETGTENLRPVLIEMCTHKLSILARDFEAAQLALDAWCRDAGVKRTLATFSWDGAALASGWVKP